MVHDFFHMCCFLPAVECIHVAYRDSSTIRPRVKKSSLSKGRRNMNMLAPLRLIHWLPNLSVPGDTFLKEIQRISLP